MGKAGECKVFPNSISEQFIWESLATTFSTMSRLILHPPEQLLFFPFGAVLAV